MPGLTLVLSRPPRASADAPSALALLAHLTEGASIRPRIDDAAAVPFLCDVAAAVDGLLARDRARATVQLGTLPEPWELGFLRSGRDVLVTVFQGGPVPEVALFERRLDLGQLRQRVVSALEEFAGDPNADAAAARLDAMVLSPSDALSHEPSVWPVEPTGDLAILLGADILVRPPSAIAPALAPAVLRADLFSLLFRGKLRIVVGDHARELPDVFVFPLAEQLVTITLDAVEAWMRGQSFHKRLTAFGAICGVKLSAGEGASLTLGSPRRPSEARAQTWTFPAVDVSTLGQGIVAFGRALSRCLVRRDRGQASNLRLHAFRARTRELGERLREATRSDAKINEAPERYRAFAAASAVHATTDASFAKTTRLRFSMRWTAAIASIDLRSTFLCGDRLIAGSTREITCLDTGTGLPLWRRSAPRGVAVMTPLGLGRLDTEGMLRLHDLGDGEVLWSTRLAPRVGSTASGVVVSGPGLPRLLIVSEGLRHLAAVDLLGGEVRWRFAARRGGIFRVRRAGKLVIIASSDSALTALDVQTGDVVWRFCDRLRFALPVASDHDALFAMAGGGGVIGRGGTRLHHVDPWSGMVRWSVDLPDHISPVGAPLLADDAVVVPSHGRRGFGLTAFDRRSGALRFDRVVCTSAASTLMVDGTVVVNGEGGELVGVAASDGAVRYRHVFSDGPEGDRPRRLEPVLRSGALFVPQSEVHVVRPSDGTLLGRVPNDLIPDLLRVNERCEVFVAEESGHLSAYSVGPRLALVPVS